MKCESWFGISNSKFELSAPLAFSFSDIFSFSELIIKGISLRYAGLMISLSILKGTVDIN